MAVPRHRLSSRRDKVDSFQISTGRIPKRKERYVVSFWLLAIGEACGIKLDLDRE
jgi:hypothetical protein